MTTTTQFLENNIHSYPTPESPNYLLSKISAKQIKHRLKYRTPIPLSFHAIIQSNSRYILTQKNADKNISNKIKIRLENTNMC
jgi:hypothetical protein